MTLQYRFSFLLLLFTYLNISAQNDTLYYSYNDTCINTTVNHYDKLLKHIIPEKTETKHQFKTDLLNLSLVRPNIAYETRLRKNTSLSFEAILGVTKSDTNKTSYKPNDWFFENIPSKNSIIHCALSADIRFYHNTKRRIYKNKNTFGFSGNYFSTGVTLKMAFYNSSLWHIDEWGKLYEFPDSKKQNKLYSYGKMTNTQSIGYLNFGYGLQRKIGNIGYYGAEFKAGIGTNKYANTLYLAYELNIRAGFSLSSLRKK